jgi:hypothetical protein
MARNGTITLVSNAGGGRTTKPTIAVGTTLKELLYAEYGADVDPDKYQFIVGGQIIAAAKTGACKLKDKDFVVVVPMNVKGN